MSFMGMKPFFGLWQLFTSLQPHLAGSEECRCINFHHQSVKFRILLICYQ
ncbi:hypothetical protein AAHE18_10G104500 [Arachis hypogaea]